MSGVPLEVVVTCSLTVVGERTVVDCILESMFGWLGGVIVVSGPEVFGLSVKSSLVSPWTVSASSS